MNAHNHPSKSRVEEPVFSADYITVLDFIRPVLAGASCGLIISFLLFPVLLIRVPLGMELSLVIGFCLTEIMALIILAMSLIYQERVWLVTLARHGPAAFERIVTLPIPYQAAFELSLAAAGEIKGGTLQVLDEQKGLIRLKTGVRLFCRRAYIVQFELRAESGSRTVVKITSELELSALHRKASDLVWGDKWSRILAKVDKDTTNLKLMDHLEHFLINVPDWDYAYCEQLADDTSPGRHERQG